MSKNNIPVSTLIGFMGSTLATVVSWSVNKSLLWAILHGVFGWLYVIYYALGNGR